MEFHVPCDLQYMTGRELQPPPETGPGLFGPRTVRGHHQKQPPMLLGLIAAADFVQGPGQVILGVGIAGMIAERPLEGGHRQLALPHFGQHAAQVRAGLDIVLVEFDDHE